MVEQTTAIAETEGGAKKGKETPTPAYISYMTFATFLAWIKEMPVTPRQLDRTLWGPKFAGSTGIQLMSALRFLGLLNGIVPTPTLDKLARADKEGRDAQMRELLRGAYGASFVDDLPSATPRIVDEALESLGTTSTTHRKAVSFFVNAAKMCGIHVPAVISKKARIKSPRLVKAPKLPVASGSGNAGGAVAPPENQTREETVKIPPGDRALPKSFSFQGTKMTFSFTIDLLTLGTDPESMKLYLELMAKFTETERLQAEIHA